MQSLRFSIVLLIAGAALLSACGDPVTTRRELAMMTAIETVAGVAREETMTVNDNFGRQLSAAELAAIYSTLPTQAIGDPNGYDANPAQDVDWASVEKVTMRVEQSRTYPSGQWPVFVTMAWRADGSGWNVTSVSRR